MAELDRRCTRLTFGVGAGAYVGLRPAGARARRSRKLAIRALSGHNVSHRGSPGARLEIPLRVLGVGESAFHADGGRGLAEVSRCTRAGVASKRPIGTRPGDGQAPQLQRILATSGVKEAGDIMVNLGGQVGPRRRRGIYLHNPRRLSSAQTGLPLRTGSDRHARNGS